jgi:FlaG/FlaF family flagellin (archaellin)
MHRPRFIKTVAALAALLTVTIFGSATALCAPPDEGTARLVTNSDGSSVETRKDGTEIIRNKNGSSVTTKPDGTKIIDNGDGSSVERRSDGTEIIRNTNGSSVVTTKKEPGKEKSDKQ